jgi:hypothetical protein
MTELLCWELKLFWGLTFNLPEFRMKKASNWLLPMQLRIACFRGLLLHVVIWL